MEMSANVQTLVEEYGVLLNKAVHSSDDHLEIKQTDLRNVLIHDCEWSPEAAGHLLRLAKDYGSFMLRNALALSLVLEIEDGELGF